MTEQEKIEYTRMFVKLLSEGTNPFTCESIDENDLICHPRVQNCMKYITELLLRLQDFIEREECESTKIEIIPEISMEEFPFSNEPIYIKELVSRLNMAMHLERPRKIAYKDVHEWLIGLGLIEIIETETGRRKVPTAEGEKMGIILEKKTKRDKEYYVIKYNLQAQRFIVEHAKEYVRPSKKENPNKKKAELQGTSWSQTHLEILVDLFNKGVPLEEIAVTLKRTKSGVRKRLKLLGYLQ